MQRNTLHWGTGSMLPCSGRGWVGVHALHELPPPFRLLKKAGENFLCRIFCETTSFTRCSGPSQEGPPAVLKDTREPRETGLPFLGGEIPALAGGQGRCGLFFGAFFSARFHGADPIAGGLGTHVRRRFRLGEEIRLATAAGAGHASLKIQPALGTGPPMVPV